MKSHFLRYWGLNCLIFAGAGTIEKGQQLDGLAGFLEPQDGGTGADTLEHSAANPEEERPVDLDHAGGEPHDPSLRQLGLDLSYGGHHWCRHLGGQVCWDTARRRVTAL